MMVSAWVISLKDHIGSNFGVRHHGAPEIHAATGGTTASAAGWSSINQPRLDQIVHAVERSNTVNNMRALQSPDTRMLEMSASQLQRTPIEANSRRLGALLPGKNMPVPSSPLRPARSWS
jgi:hypothetical protein